MPPHHPFSRFRSLDFQTLDSKGPITGVSGVSFHIRKSMHVLTSIRLLWWDLYCFLHTQGTGKERRFKIPVTKLLSGPILPPNCTLTKSPFQQPKSIYHPYNTSHTLPESDPIKFTTIDKSVSLTYCQTKPSITLLWHHSARWWGDDYRPDPWLTYPSFTYYFPSNTPLLRRFSSTRWM